MMSDETATQELQNGAETLQQESEAVVRVKKTPRQRVIFSKAKRVRRLKKLKRSLETEEQRSARLAKNRERISRLRANETPEKRMARLARLSYVNQRVSAEKRRLKARANESKEQRAKRLAINRKRRATKARASETANERSSRLAKDRRRRARASKSKNEHTNPFAQRHGHLRANESAEEYILRVSQAGAAETLWPHYWWTSGTPLKEDEIKKEHIPLEPAIEIKEEPVDYDPTPSTSTEVSNEEFILPHEENTWAPSVSATHNPVVEPQITLSVASLSSPVLTENLEDALTGKKRKIQASSTFVPSTKSLEPSPQSPVYSCGESSNQGSSKDSRKDQFDVFAEYIATKLRGLDHRSCAYAQKAIADIIFEAEMGKFTGEDTDCKPQIVSSGS